MIDDGAVEQAGQSEAVPLVQDRDRDRRDTEPGMDDDEAQMSTSQTPMSAADRFVVQHHPDLSTVSTESKRSTQHEANSPMSPMSPQPRGGVRVPPQFRRLKKYASDACFALGTASGGGGASAAGSVTQIELIGGPCSSTSTASETPSPPMAVSFGGSIIGPGTPPEASGTQGGPTTYYIREIKNFDPSAAQHPRFFAPGGAASSGTAAGTIQRRRQDSDDASGSLGSETTVASGNGGGGAGVPPLPRTANKRFKMRRPRSTGNVIPAGAPGATVTGAHYLNNAGEPARSRNVIYDHSAATVTGGVDSNSVMFFYPEHDNNNNNNGNRSKIATSYGNSSGNHCPNYNTMNSSGNYDPSFTSATIHSLDDSFQHPQADTYSNGVPSAGPGADNERRTSNYYLFENDSNHEFDDEINDDFDNVTLMYSKHEKIPMKDFGSEIRATMDIDHLLNKAILLLDLQETSIEEIFAKIIHEMDIQEPEFTSEQVRSVLFTQDSGNQFHILSRTVQSICTTGTVSCNYDYDQTWICALCMLNTVQHRHVAIARLSHPTNLGRTMQDLRFIIIKGTKTALETTRTFATLFSDMDIRQRLVMANSVEAFRTTLLGAAKELALEQSQWRERKASIHLSQAKEQVFGPGSWYPFRGLVEDLMRRKRHYASDYLDGLRGHRTVQKMFSSVIFLYFACILPAIAFGVLNDDNTKGGINVRKVIFAQAIGGIFFAIFGGQPMIILLTTVPLAIYIKVIFRISQSLGYDFFAMYTCVGLWCQFFLIIYAATELCNLMKLATRSAEEMFSLFIAIAFTVESIRAIHTSFVNNYNGCDENYKYKPPTSANVTLLSTQNYTLFERLINPELRHNITVAENLSFPCHRDTSILYMLLTCGTLWLAMWLYNFRKTPYLTRSRREWLADYALPASVLIMSFAGAYCFSEIDKDMFKLRTEMNLFAIPAFWALPPKAIVVCFLLGFFLSFLFFMDQNITSAIVNNSQNKLKKGSAQHLDLFVVAILNMFLSIMGLPWMHGALPHSPLHIRALADVEERLAQGHVHEVIMNVRETRLASLIAHILILGSTFFLLPFPLQWIPTSVLHGLFLYMAFTSLTGNEMMERLLLLITEQQAYPPTHYIRRVPQRKVHLFTTCQLIQLVILCAVGFSPYPFVEMVFPIVCFCFLPIRHILIPRLIDYKYLEALDGKH